MLTRGQKEAIAVLSIGTFLEYSEFMICVHMAPLLNDLFFPKVDPHINSIYSAIIFCSTLLLRPLGSLIFGWIGDNISRRTAVIITSLIMSITCAIMSVLPTYAQIGIAATYIITMCRVIQSLASSSELIGVQLYLTEITKPPIRYPVVTLLSVFTTLGGVNALGIASYAITYSNWSLYSGGWRIAFLFGAILAFIGSIARVTLQEAPAFSRALSRKYSRKEKTYVKNNDIRHSIVAFCVYCGWPVCFYFVYIYCSDILKYDFGLSSKQVIQHNFFVSIIELIGAIIITFFSYKIPPLKIVKAKLLLFIITVISMPFLIEQIHSRYTIFCIQCCVLLFSFSFIPALPIIYKNISILRRFTYVSFVYAASRVIMYPITAFSAIYLTRYLDYWGLLIIMIPMIIAYAYGILYFDKLEK